MGAILRAHPVHGESRIQRRASRELITLFVSNMHFTPNFRNPEEVLFFSLFILINMQLMFLLFCVLFLSGFESEKCTNKPPFQDPFPSHAFNFLPTKCVNLYGRPHKKSLWRSCQ